MVSFSHTIVSDEDRIGLRMLVLGSDGAICVSQVFLSVTKSDYLCHYVGL